MLLDLLFPKICLGCASEGSWLCQQCRGQLQSVEQLRGCPGCNEIASGKFCLAHQRGNVLTGIITVGLYDNPLLAKAIHYLKYQGVRYVAEPLGQLLGELICTFELATEPILLPVPLHKSRKVERGYNQAELLAANSGLVCDFDAVLRTKKTKAQASLDAVTRLTNLNGCFAMRSSAVEELRGKTIIIVDDVITTGTTVAKIAEIVMLAEPSEIWAAGVGRG